MRTHTALEKELQQELKGCGNEIWKNVDAQQYVNKLREEWD